MKTISKALIAVIAAAAMCLVPVFAIADDSDAITVTSGEKAVSFKASSITDEKFDGLVTQGYKNYIADEAFNAEYEAQGRASPMDASCCTFGKGIAINCPDSKGKEVWAVSKGGTSWRMSEVAVPDMTFVVGYTGIKARTGPLVEKVRKYKEHNRFASDIVDEIGKITLDGVDAMAHGNLEELGDIMTQNHKLLSILGVSCNELNKLVKASLDYSYGAKLTGSGGGGSMIALTDEPKKVCEAILLHGGLPFIVKTGVPGVTVE